LAARRSYTQSFEFVATIAEAFVAGGRLVVPDADFQPIAATDVASASSDGRAVSADQTALSLGTPLEVGALAPVDGEAARLGRTRSDAWLAEL
jgi:hypothetical protein